MCVIVGMHVTNRQYKRLSVTKQMKRIKHHVDSLDGPQQASYVVVACGNKKQLIKQVIIRKNK